MLLRAALEGGAQGLVDGTVAGYEFGLTWGAGEAAFASLAALRAAIFANTAAKIGRLGVGRLPTPSEAANLVRVANPVGSAKLGDAFHRAVPFAVDDIAAHGTVFAWSAATV